MNAISWKKAVEFYRKLIRKMICFLRERQWKAAAVMFGTMLLEPLHAIKAGFATPLGWRKRFNFYQFNPGSVTSEQAQKRPILLIHGNYHNQSAWLDFAKKLAATNFGLGPIYTINLPSGEITNNDYDCLDEKINSIKGQYCHYGYGDTKIDIVGHSRGAYLAQMAIKNILGLSNYIGKLIKIGSILDKENFDLIRRQNPVLINHIYEIRGLKDCIECGKSLLPQRQRLDVDSGHLGLLYLSKTHEQIIEWLLL